MPRSVNVAHHRVNETVGVYKNGFLSGFKMRHPLPVPNRETFCFCFCRIIYQDQLQPTSMREKLLHTYWEGMAGQLSTTGLGIVIFSIG